MNKLSVAAVATTLTFALGVTALTYYATKAYHQTTINTELADASVNLAKEAFTTLRQLQDNQLFYAYRLLPQLTAKNTSASAFNEALHESLNLYFVKAGILDLVGVIVKDSNASEVASAYKNKNLSSYLSCKQSTIEKINSVLCLHEGELFSEVSLPFKAAQQSMQLTLIVNTKKALLNVINNQTTASQLKIAGEQAFASSDFSAHPTDGSHLVSFNIPSSDNKTAATLSRHVSLKNLHQALKTKSEDIYLLNSFIVILGIVVFLFIIRVSSQRRSEANAQLSQNTAFIDTLLHSTKNSVLSLDLDTSIQINNSMFHKLIGKEGELLQGDLIENHLKLFHSNAIESPANWKQLIQDCSLNKKAETLIYYKDSGEKRELEITCTPHRTANNEHIGYVLIIKDVTNEKKLRQQLIFDARHDQLTSLYNRLAFHQYFEQLSMESERKTQQHALIYLDLDQFKIINDTCGHAAGDTLLQQVTALMKLSIRQNDFLARIGGDEFALILPSCSIDRACLVLDDLIQRIIEYRYVHEDKVLRVGISAGVAIFGDKHDTLNNIMASVDSACYLAKKAGGNQYHIYLADDEVLSTHQASMDWVANLNDALTENRFTLYMQVIAPLSDTSNLQHHEVLVRYVEKDGTIINPTSFMSAAERYNLSERIDRWVVSHSLDWLSEHKNNALSINLSGRSISSTSFQQFLETSIKNSKIDPSKLCFEITETAVISNVERSIEFMENIKNLGVKLSLDDFGSGLSSFSYLKKFPVDYLKIDGELVKDLLTDKQSFIFIRSITEVGHSMGMQVIAEYVLDKAMYTLLRKAKVDHVQGYAVGKPLPMTDLDIKSESEDEKKFKLLKIVKE